MTEPVKRVAVVGAGAMGSVYGATLHRGGVDVTLVDVAPPVIEALRNNGLRIEREGEETRTDVPITDDPSSVGAVDLVVFFVKCYHTRVAAESAKAMLDDGTTVVTLQNGWGNGDVLAEVFGGERVVLGSSYHSATALGPGQVAHTAVGPTVLGNFEGAGDRADRVAEVLSRVGLDAAVKPNVRTEIWKKVTLNAAALPTSALTGLVAGEVAKLDSLMDVVNALAREAVDVGRAAGFDIDIGERITAIRGALERAGNGKASMLQDVEAGRRTEIDVVNGAVARLGREHGIPTPLNDAMVGLVAGYERGHMAK